MHRYIIDVICLKTIYASRSQHYLHFADGGTWRYSSTHSVIHARWRAEGTGDEGRLWQTRDWACVSGHSLAGGCDGWGARTQSVETLVSWCLEQIASSGSEVIVALQDSSTALSRLLDFITAFIQTKKIPLASHSFPTTTASSARVVLAVLNYVTLQQPMVFCSALFTKAPLNQRRKDLACNSLRERNPSSLVLWAAMCIPSPTLIITSPTLD